MWLSLLLACAISFPFIASVGVRRFTKSKVSHFAKNDTYSPQVSFVVATYNEEKRVVAKLDNLLEQDYPHEKMQIVVVDSSVDTTRALVRQWATEHPSVNLVLVGEPKRMGLAHALNLGYRTATGEIVIKSDCDILVNKDATKSLVADFADPRIGGVSAKQSLLRRVRIEEGYRSLFDSKRILESQFGAAYQFEPFCAFRKSLVGLIEENSVADDAEVAIGIIRKGYATVLEPSASFFEDTPMELRKRLAQKQRRAQGHIQLVLQNRDMLFGRKFGIFGVVLFPITFAMIIVNPWLIVIMIGSTLVGLWMHFGWFGILLFAAGLTAIMLVYTTGNPPLLAGLIESQLSLIIGWLRLIVRGPEHMWKRVA